MLYLRINLGSFFLKDEAIRLIDNVKFLAESFVNRKKIKNKFFIYINFFS